MKTYFGVDYPLRSVEVLGYRLCFQEEIVRDEFTCKRQELGFPK
jgi:hypothetical protein